MALTRQKKIVLAYFAVLGGLTIAGLLISLLPQEQPAEAQRAAEYLRENFNLPGLETTWFPHITGVRVRGDTLILLTDLPSVPSELASGVCRGGSAYVFVTAENPHLGRVLVLASDGSTLIYRRSVRDPCD